MKSMLLTKIKEDFIHIASGFYNLSERIEDFDGYLATGYIFEKDIEAINESVDNLISMMDIFYKDWEDVLEKIGG